jgi:hypothetical protein
LGIDWTKVDWESVASLIAFFSLTVAVIALVVETRRSRIALQVETLLRLNQELQTPRIRSLRKLAARKLLDHARGNQELDELLEFLEEISFMYELGVIDERLMYENYSWWIVRYWLSGQRYIRRARDLDPRSWTSMERAVNRLRRIEKKKGYRTDDYSEAKLRRFLQDEARVRIRF